MNGSRSTSPRHGDRSSLDALSRTIEGLEARIEGLMGAAARESRPQTHERDALADRDIRRDRPAERARPPEREPRPDPLAEIRQRQRALEAGRERSYSRAERHPDAERSSGGMRATETRAPETRATDARTHDIRASETRAQEARQRDVYARPAAGAPFAAQPQPDAGMKDIAQALVNLRQELKQDISEGVAREMTALRAEIRSIKASAQDQRFAEDMREDLTRLAESIDQLGRQPTSGREAEGLRVEFEELRSLMDGLAREDSVNRMQDTIRSLDIVPLQEELVSLAYRLDDIKSELGGMAAGPAVRALEDKLLLLASAMEQLGDRMRPGDHAIAEQFAGLDLRLDEISRAIVAGTRSSSTEDPALLQRLESRIASLAEQIDHMGREATGRSDPAAELGARIEALSLRIEELANAEAASRLEERLEQLSALMERSQKAPPAPELTGYLADISRKIDALDHGSVNDVLSERLDYLARRIDEMEIQPPAAAFDGDAFLRLEGRLSDIAARLEETAAAPPGDQEALRALEDQIANLSVLISTPRQEAAGMPSEFEDRMSALEDYMTTSDEYIIEAARQAAEAAVEAYSRNGALGGAAPAAEMSALSALAEDLRHLEDLSRSSEERTHKTFEALHDTLVQIAERLDHMDNRLHDQPELRDQPEYASARQERPLPKAAWPAAAQPVHPVNEDIFSQEAFDAELAAYPPRETPHGPENAVEAPLAEDTRAMGATDLAAEAAGQPAATKSSLLSGLTRRFLAGRKEQPARTERAVVAPTPSLAPVDMIPTEAANELLEPGSGAPDVKKILERVRASQNAQRAGASSESERADYIAAARRAAQAAAQEVDPASRLSPARNTGKSIGAVFSRHRRPILMAVGAILLAIMAMPLISTLTNGEQAPQPVQTAATQRTAASEEGLTAAGGATAVATHEISKEPALADAAGAATQSGGSGDGAVPAENGNVATAHLTGSEPLAGDGQASKLTLSSEPVAARETSAFLPKTAEAAADGAPVSAAAAVAAITVPDTIAPASLADAARNGDPLALFEIGARYTEGRGVPADLSQAAKWYQLAADKGFAPAQYRLGNLFEKGTGVERNPDKARQYYSQAADKGNASAMHNLAVLFATGMNGKADYASAVRWFVRAADLGVADSQFNLAILYARGNGVPQDLEESYKWFAIAARDGDKDAAQKRDEVANAMGPEQLEKARAKVKAWTPQPLDSSANSVELPDEWTGKGIKTGSVDMKKAIRNIQAILNNNGFDAGTPDGEMGKKTVIAIKAFQKSIGMEQTGKINDALVKELLARNK